MSLLSSTQLILAIGGAVVVVGYVALILAPAWVSFGRLWERLAAGALTLVMLVTLVAIGAAVGVAVVWGYISL